MAEPDVNSSDFEQLLDDEDERRMLQPNSNSGKRIAEAILLNQATDRVLSKRNARQLTFVRGAPSSREKQSSVFTAWQAFCQTINHDVEQCPSGEQIFRFVDTRVRQTKPSLSDKMVPSISTIQGIWRTLIDVLRFRHRNLKEHYTEQDVIRISTHLDQLVMQKRLVRGLWQKKQWLGFVVMQRIARNWLERALAEGTTSWDQVLMRLLGVVVAVSCNARSGDIARTRLYTGLECLCWRHVELKLEDGAELTVQNLMGKITLEFTKGHKNAVNQDRIVFLNPLSEGSHSAICPVKLLLIVALRLGYVHGTTINEVLVHAARRSDRTIQWTKPQAPVVCLLGKGVDTSAFDKPAGQDAFTSSLKQMALSAGVLQAVNSRHARNGGLRDAAYLGKRIIGVADRCVALVAGHTTVSLNSGTTAGYVGALQQPIYNNRADALFQDRLAPTFAAEGYTPTKLKKVEVDEYMTEQGMNKDDAKQRDLASVQLKRRRVAEWRAREADRVTDEPTANETHRIKEPIASRALAERTPSQINAEQTRPAAIATDPTEVPAEDLTQEKYFSTASATPATTSTQTPQSAIDPRLLGDEMAAASVARDIDDEDAEVTAADMNSLNNIIFATTDGLSGEESADEAADLDAIDDALVEAALADYTPPPDRAAASLPGDAFVQAFSKVNWYKMVRHFDRSNPEEVARYVRVGNSRDTPTPWLLYCSKGACKFSSALPYEVTHHKLGCKGTDKTQKDFSCAYEGCQCKFDTEEILRAHVNHVHLWVPKPCPRCPDKPNVLFGSAKEYDAHKNKEHLAILDQPTRCPLFDKCKDEKIFDGKKKLRRHLQRYHLLTAEEIQVHVPYSYRGRQKLRTECPEDGCEGESAFATPGGLRKHLVQVHGMTRAEAEVVVPITRAHGIQPVTTCPKDEYKGKGAFATATNLRKHLVDIHKMTKG